MGLDPHRVLYRWDLDKTYLRTEFDTVRDLLRTAVEKPIDKRTVPGASALLRELRATEPAGIAILSGSPSQMRKALEAKLRLDGVTWDHFTLKPSLQKLLRGKVRFLRDQLSYKLGALLTARATGEPDVREMLFGDDAEADAFIYSLYADIAAGRIGEETLLAVFERARVYKDDIPHLIHLSRQIPRRDHVARIFIHLDRMRSQSSFEDFGNRVCPCNNYFQAAVVLLESGVLDAAAVYRIAVDLILRDGFDEVGLVASFDEMARQGFVGMDGARLLADRSVEADGNTFGIAARSVAKMQDHFSEREGRLGPSKEVALHPIDYVDLFSRDKARAHAAKRRAKWRRR